MNSGLLKRQIMQAVCTKTGLRFLFALTCLAVAATGLAQDRLRRSADGSVMLIGDVLSFAQRDVWKSIFESAGGEGADVVVIAAAHERAKLYGNYAVRALERYGVFVELLPLAVDEQQFGTDFRELVYDPDLLKQVERAQAVFFVGGAPQRLELLFYNDVGYDTPLATAIKRLHAAGGLVVAGISGAGGADTGLNAVEALRRGRLLHSELHRGLNLIPGNWVVDQHFFSPGRIAETLVAMRQLEIDFAIGMAPDGTALVKQGRLNVGGAAGVVTVDLSTANMNDQSGGLRLTGARLGYLDDGDRLDLASLELTPSTRKLDGFVLSPGAAKTSTSAVSSYLSKNEIVDMVVPGHLRQLMIDALTSEERWSEGLLQAMDGKDSGSGFLFRFYTGSDTRGWIDADSGRERYTISNLYLDITPTKVDHAN